MRVSMEKLRRKQRVRGGGRLSTIRGRSSHSCPETERGLEIRVFSKSGNGGKKRDQIGRERRKGCHSPRVKGSETARLKKLLRAQEWDRRYEDRRTFKIVDNS